MYRVLYLSLLYTGCLLLTTNMYGQQTALKTNLLFWATTTPNTGVEFGMGRQFTMDIWGAYNAWKYPDDMRLNLYLIQPEVRFWPCRKFEGHFFGLHGHYGHFNVGMIPFISGLKDHVFLRRRRNLWLSLGGRQPLGIGGDDRRRLCFDEIYQI